MVRPMRSPGSLTMPSRRQGRTGGPGRQQPDRSSRWARCRKARPIATAAWGTARSGVSSRPQPARSQACHGGRRRTGSRTGKGGNGREQRRWSASAARRPATPAPPAGTRQRPMPNSFGAQRRQPAEGRQQRADQPGGNGREEQGQGQGRAEDQRVAAAPTRAADGAAVRSLGVAAAPFVLEPRHPAGVRAPARRGPSFGRRQGRDAQRQCGEFARGRRRRGVSIASTVGSPQTAGSCLRSCASGDSRKSADDHGRVLGGGVEGNGEEMRVADGAADRGHSCARSSGSRPWAIAERASPGLKDRAMSISPSSSSLAHRLRVLREVACRRARASGWSWSSQAQSGAVAAAKSASVAGCCSRAGSAARLIERLLQESAADEIRRRRDR